MLYCILCLFSAECVWDFVCECLSVCDTVCLSFLFAVLSPIHNLVIILLTELLQFCLMYKDKILMYIFHVMKPVTCSEFF